MTKNRGSRIVLLLCCVIFVAVTADVSAQFRREPTPNDTLTSAEVHPGGEITFRIYAPEAGQVMVAGDMGFQELSKQDNGVWSGTVDAVNPGVYRYSFTVDGVTVQDPRSPIVNESRALVKVRSDGEDYWAMKTVPHGDVRQVWYESSTLDTIRRMYVYTPPDYDTGAESLPVLYLIHGGGDNDVAWTSAGRANFILDNLLAAGEIDPMIVVMPNGSIPTETFTEDLINDIIPTIEEKYRVKTDKDNRALAGLSMGGLETLDAGIEHYELFGYIGVLSSGWLPNQTEMIAEAEQIFTESGDEMNQSINLFWIAMGGEEDIAYENCQKMLAIFDEHDIEYTYYEQPGGHTWGVWRDNLHMLAPMLFH